MSDEQGGYYAIKGFAYQIDKAIIEILSSDSDQRIGVEGIQDIDADDFVMQVKHREASKYSASTIREPVLQLLEEFCKHPDKTYTLYCHFHDRGEEEVVLDRSQLEDILKLSTGTSDKAKKLNQRISEIGNESKDSFVEKFRIIFSPEFQEQYIAAISVIEEVFDTKSGSDEQYLYYPWICDLITKGILDAPAGQGCDFCKSEIVSIINSNKRQIYDIGLSRFVGDQALFRFGKTRFLKPKLDRENFIFIGDMPVSAEMPLPNLIHEITDKHFKNATYNVKPLTFIVKDDLLNRVKIDLCDRGELINDGYESISLNSSELWRRPTSTRKTRGGRATDTLNEISFRVRIVSQSGYEQCAENAPTPSMTYILGSGCTIFSGGALLEYSILSTKHIYQLFCE